MWSLKKNNIRLRFTLIVSFAVTIVFLIAISIATAFQRKQSEVEFKRFIVSQAIQTLSSHPAERKEGSFLYIQRLLLFHPRINGAALFDKECNLLTATSLHGFTKNDCKSSKKLIRIQYDDVLSSIGHITLDIDKPKYLLEILYISTFGLILAGVLTVIITYLWNVFLYRPLTRSLASLERNEEVTWEELGAVGEKLSILVQEVKAKEASISANKVDEQRLRTSLQIAHDVLPSIRTIRRLLLNEPSSLIETEANHIESVVCDLLPEKVNPMFSTVALRELFENSISRAVSAKDNPDINITNNIPQEKTVRAISTFLARAATNLITNAIEVQPPTIPISVDLIELEGEISIAISDSGPGISFITEGTTSKKNGSGLGISSAREALKRTEAELHFESNRAGGTTATITFHRQTPEVWLAHDESLYVYNVPSNPLDIDFFPMPLKDQLSKRVTILTCQSGSIFANENIRWIVVRPEEIERIKFIRLKSVTLIEDDKYVRQKWMESAQKNSIQLESSCTIPLTHPKDPVFLDRYLGDIDTNDYFLTLKNLGIEVRSISTITCAEAKTPPWDRVTTT